MPRHSTAHDASGGRQQFLPFTQSEELQDVTDDSPAVATKKQVLLLVWANKVDVPASELGGAKRSPMQEASAVWRAAKHLSGKIPNVSLSVHNFQEAEAALQRMRCMSTAKKTSLLIVDLERRADAQVVLAELEALWKRRNEINAPVYLPVVFGREPNWANDPRNRTLQLALKRFGDVEFVHKAIESKRAFWVAVSALRRIVSTAAESL